MYRLWALGALIVCASPALAQAQGTAFVDFQCRIEFPANAPTGAPAEVDTQESFKFCGPDPAKFISIECRTELANYPGGAFTATNGEVPCRINGAACGVPGDDTPDPVSGEIFPGTVAADRARLRIRDTGLVTLNCLYLGGPPPP